MAKPRLEKVEALFYVLKQVAKGGCIRILIHPLIFLCYMSTYSISGTARSYRKETVTLRKESSSLS